MKPGIYRTAGDSRSRGCTYTIFLKQRLEGSGVIPEGAVLAPIFFDSAKKS